MSGIMVHIWSALWNNMVATSDSQSFETECSYMLHFRWESSYRILVNSLSALFWKFDQSLMRHHSCEEREGTAVLSRNSLCPWLRAYEHAERTICVHTTALKSVRWLVLHILVDFCWQKSRGLWAQAQGREVHLSTLADFLLCFYHVIFCCWSNRLFRINRTGPLLLYFLMPF